MAKKISVCLTFDFDAMSVWIGTFHARSPSAISRGEFGNVGAQRILAMLREWGLPSTWFVPGHTADAFPDTVEKIAADLYKTLEREVALDPAAWAYWRILDQFTTAS